MANGYISHSGPTGNYLYSDFIQRIQVYVNDQEILHITDLSGSEWVQESGYWVAGNSSSATIWIDNYRISSNDFCIDDIQFYSEHKDLDHITITGPASVAEGSLTPYTCTARFTDDTEVDVSESAQWSVVDAPSGAYMQGNYLRAPKVGEELILGIEAEYEHDNMTKQTEGAFFDVAILPTLEVTIGSVSTFNEVESRFDVQLFTTSSTPNGSITNYQWDLDGDGEKDDSTDPMPTISLIPGETRLVGVEVIDTALKKDIDWQFITKDKPSVDDETTVGVVHNISKSPIEYWGHDGNQFTFEASKVDNGLIIIVHGRNDAATNLWVQAMGEAIENALSDQSIPLPNIALYDWSPMANTDRYTGKGDPDGLELDDLLEVREYGIAHGIVVADWIQENIDLGNINANAPIHMIGHSAGGFVSSRCADLLGDVVTQVTILDTPMPYGLLNGPKNFIKNGGLLESYITIFGGQAFPVFNDQTYNAIVCNISFEASPVLRYLTTIVNLNDPPPYGDSYHSWAHEWYRIRTVEDENNGNGFYYSPFITPNDFHGYDPDTYSAMAMMAMAAAEATIDSMPITNFNSFGDVEHNDPQYTITEAANAGIYKELALPIGAQSIEFQYQFASAGDGDFLSVHWGTNETSFIGLDLGISRDNPVDGIVSLAEHAGTTNTLTFKLVSRNATNAVLSISNIVMEVSSDPDGDGLDTDTEISLGTDPLNGDSDGDGVSDGDEVNTHGSDPNLPDSDGDGLTDGQEIQCGTSPTNAMDRLEILDFIADTNQEFTLKWSSVGGKQYDIHRSKSLPMDSYTTVADGIYATAPTNTFTDPTATNAVHFYRILLKE